MSCAGVIEISRPRKRIAPVRGGVSPEIERNVVVLPAPFDPIRVTISPSLTVRLIPFNASMFP